jgi:uncharacterized protein (TIGR02001 family)
LRARVCATSLTALLFLSLAAPASAEVGATASLLSEARLRGYSLSAGRPVGQLDLSYDDRSGFYAGLSASVVAYHGVNPLGLQENIGFAKRLSGGPAIDFGILNSNYSRHADYLGQERSLSYSEVYAGVIGKNVASHVYLSPNYFGYGVWALYGEVDASVAPARKLRLTGHLGALTYLGGGGGGKSGYDWRIGVSREVGPLSAQLAVTGGGPGRDNYRNDYHSRTAVVLAISTIL